MSSVGYGTGKIPNFTFKYWYHTDTVPYILVSVPSFEEFWYGCFWYRYRFNTIPVPCSSLLLFNITSLMTQPKKHFYFTTIFAVTRYRDYLFFFY
ncbi:hypothetical protein HanRHA438_Chr08g0361281 [Helianthus annuus]|nr:hypothetical protein HanRHA438_Chr08g0361281 [Helianthus annuus]